MIWWWLCVLGCSATLRRVLPGGAVLSPTASSHFDAVTLPEVTYTGPAKVSAPLPPLQFFGIYYGVDVVIVSDHPDWDMHEYARLDTPEGPIWMAKDSDMDLVQTISINRPDFETWAPEVPVPRQHAPISVSEEWDGRRLSFEMDYTNPHGEPVEVTFSGVVPRKPPGLRNGNTMGHSQQAVAAVLDLERFGHRGKATISINGQPQRVERLFGIYSMKFLLQQAQAGLARADYAVSPTAEGVTITRPGGPVEWPTHSTESWSQHEEGALTLLRHDDGYLVHTHAFAAGGLVWSQIEQHGRDIPVLRASFSPALPDVTRPFSGEAESTFRLDVNGQIGHGTGIVRARWADEHAVILEVEPTAPSWLLTRPMVGNIRYSEHGARVRIRRLD